MDALEFKIVKIEKPQDVNIILGQSHFIKTVEDLYEVLMNNVPGIKFGLAFNESSGACLVRSEGNDPELNDMAVKNALAIGAGHCFLILLRNAYPVNVLNAIKNIPEVCNIYCATANNLEVVVAQTPSGCGIMGVIDGAMPKGSEAAADIKWRKELLRKIGYKL
ncbi:MAG: adenosine-specific kinase [Candidatus Omnitrophica bacterium]|nr:adenosine-specific kinase [Candidatus Omnitrophota bacterium]